MEERKVVAIGGIIAGGSVNVEQHIVRRLQKRDSDFWSKPVQDER
jgi:hypothetical protein